ncbi:MAG: hypothetical protein LBE89_06090, partial [Helicobacteraceae bacterium]|nr:hypothetical protein [Helicobacteraceae bacterium]
SATTPDLTYAAFWADDFPNNGPIYYMTANGYTPEMFISAETAGANTITSNPAGTISWKALDVTRNPAEWFNPANGFELFWAEKERGYWVYLSQGFNNPVTLADVQFSSTSRVYKHFNVPEVGGESDVYPVFNWFSGSLTARVGGLVRANYTSGQSYNVQADVNGETVVLTPTGPVYAAGSDFTAYVSDFAVSSLRPTSAIEAEVTASDGLGGRNSGSTVLQYVQPSTPTLSFNGNILTAASDPNAHNILLFNGHPSDANYNHIEAYAATEGNVSIDLSAVEGINYPVALAVPTDGEVADENNVSFRDIVKELLIGASTGAPDTLAGSFSSGTSVYSNLRRQFYLPVYSNTAHLRVSASENNATKPIAFYQTGTLDQTKNDYGVQLAGNGSNLQNRIATVVFQPKDAALADGGLTHANLYTDGNEFVGELGYIQSVYQGEVFYVFVIEDTTGATGSWYYGVFQGNNGLQWGVNGNINGGGDPYKLVVRRVDTLQQL